MNVVITQTKTGVRVHRETCRRQGTSISVDDATNDQLRAALPASCCKPPNVAALLRPINQPSGYADPELDQAVSDALEASQEDDVTTDASEEPDEMEPEPEPSGGIVPGPVHDVLIENLIITMEPGVVTQPVIFSGKDYFWSSLGKHGGMVVAHAVPGVVVKVVNPTMTLELTGQQEAVERAVGLITQLWEAAPRFIKPWLKSDVYKQAMAMEASEYSYGPRRAFYVDFADGYASRLRGNDVADFAGATDALLTGAELADAVTA